MGVESSVFSFTESVAAHKAGCPPLATTYPRRVSKYGVVVAKNRFGHDK